MIHFRNDLVSTHFFPKDVYTKDVYTKDVYTKAVNLIDLFTKYE
jgi:hypothetical protein